MNTPYSKVFKSYLSKIKDYELGELEDIVADSDMVDILNSAIVGFRLPKVKIWDKDDDFLTFNVELSYEEIEVIATLMVREWFKRMINNTDTLIQQFGETDFEFKSQANHLKALAEAYREVINLDVKTKLSNYSRTYKGEVFNYNLLAGKK